MDRIKSKTELPHSAISEIIIGCCFEIMRELGSGFLENVYKNALFIAMKEKGLNDVLLTGGGIIPDADMKKLNEIGVGTLFPPGTDTKNIVEYITTFVKEHRKF